MNASLTARAREVRERIRARTLSPAEFRKELLSVADGARDDWTHEVLELDAPPSDVDLPRGGVPYLPSTVAAIVACVDEAPVGKGDVFVDLGSGLGKVALLVHLLTGAKTRGVEVQGHLVERARETAERLGLSEAVQFVQGDAGEAISDGNVYFIYASFNGPMLERVLTRLHERAKKTAVVVCAVDFTVDVPWLKARRATRGEVTLYDESPPSRGT